MQEKTRIFPSSLLGECSPVADLQEIKSLLGSNPTFSSLSSFFPLKSETDQLVIRSDIVEFWVKEEKRSYRVVDKGRSKAIVLSGDEKGKQEA